MKRKILILPVLAAAAFLGACRDEHVGVRHSAYVGDYGDADFYYSQSRPYSHAYGALIVRDGGYYYRRGGDYYRYERPAGVAVRRSVVRRDYDGDRRVVVRRDYDGDRQVTVRRRVVEY